MDFSAWTPCNSQGVIAESLLPCELFRLRWYIEWQYDIVDPSRLMDNLTGKWRWTISQGGAVVFAQAVTAQVQLVWLSLGGVVDLFTWSYNPAAERVTTTTPVKPPILGANPVAWVYDDLKAEWHNVAEQGTPDPGGAEVADVTNRTAIIQFWWESPAYEIPLESGATVAIPFHNVGAPWLVKLASVQVATSGTGGIGAMVDRPGIYRVAQPTAGRLRQNYSLDGGHTFRTRRTAYRLTTPSITKDLTNRLYVGGKLTEVGWVVVRSDDDGLTWLEAPVLIFDTGYTSMKLAVARDGTVVAIARKAGGLYCRTSIDQFGSTTYAGPATRAFELALESATGRLLATDGLATVYQSWDQGRTWQTITGSIT